MRLIDADALKEHIKKYTSVFARYDWREICEMLNNAPTVDAVEVVRCKDCKWRYTQDCPLVIATNHMANHGYGNFESKGDNGFCSWGKRREDGKND